MIDLQADMFQHGIGPYWILRFPDGSQTKMVVGYYDAKTRRTQAPEEGNFMIDDPVYGTVFYDENLMRVIMPQPSSVSSSSDSQPAPSGE